MMSIIMLQVKTTQNYRIPNYDYFAIFTGIPELGVAPFDPHFAKEVKQIRAIAGLGYTLMLTDVYERGWTTSTVTKYK